MESSGKQRLEKNGKSIRVHEDLIKVLEELRKRLNDLTYDIAGNETSYYVLSGILARKIEGKIK